MPETNTVACMLCGREAPPLDMAPVGAQVLGHHLDFALAFKWFCPEPCFKTYKHSAHLRGRIRQFQDSAVEWARTCVANVSEEALREMEELPEGLRVDASEHQRVQELREHLKLFIEKDSIKKAALEKLRNEEPVDPSWVTRFMALKKEIKEKGPIESFEDNHLLHRVCRNINKNPFYNPRTHAFKSYDQLVSDLRTLETLTEDERKQLE